MKYRLFIFSLLLITINMTGNSQSINRFISTWEGKLDFGVSLRIVFHIRENNNGDVSATADSPDQSAFGLKCDTVIIKGDSISIEMRNLKAVVSGKLITDSTINGTFTQGGGTIPLLLKKGTGVSVARIRPQTPKPPFPYKSEEVEFDNADKSMHYGATITIPEGKGPFPAALLITGSGQQDRDETILEHKPFAVLADALTRNGFVVLRVDDRGTGKSSGKFNESTTADFAIDATNSFNYLLSRSEVNKQKTGLIGHSEGGLIAPMIASQRKDVDFVVLLAAPGIKIDALMIEQNKAILHSSGISQRAIDAYIPLYAGIMKQVLMSADPSVMTTSAANIVQQWKDHTDTSLIKELGFPLAKSAGEIAQPYIEQFNSKWYRYFLSADPQPYLQKLHGKVFALNGSRDIQVISSPDLAGIEASLKKSSVKTYTVKELPGLNHLFQTCIKCTLAEYGELDETFSPVALQEINTWLTKNVK